MGLPFDRDLGRNRPLGIGADNNTLDMDVTETGTKLSTIEALGVTAASPARTKAICFESTAVPSITRNV